MHLRRSDVEPRVCSFPRHLSRSSPHGWLAAARRAEEKRTLAAAGDPFARERERGSGIVGCIADHDPAVGLRITTRDERDLAATHREAREHNGLRILDPRAERLLR